jgi:acetoin utilization deacetylase AcuC-like enzyme
MLWFPVQVRAGPPSFPAAGPRKLFEHCARLCQAGLVIIINDEQCLDYSHPGHPERPARVAETLRKLRVQDELPISWQAPAEVDEALLLRAHTPEMLARLNEPRPFDEDTPFYENIAVHARRSAGGALAAMRAARRGETAFSLMRPPGHHATRTKSMGFCFLNSIAIAALAAHAEGAGRVAVLDFDLHHGNGTEDILLYHPGIAFFSVHLFPEYPDSGGEHVGENCFNFPVAPHTSRADYLRTLTRALEAVKAFNPDLIAVSAGFDAYVREPIADGVLDIGDYHWLGAAIRGLNVPAFSILEGGYSSKLPELVFAYLRGLCGK